MIYQELLLKLEVLQYQIDIYSRTSSKKTIHIITKVCDRSEGYKCCEKKEINDNRLRKS